MRLKPGEVCRSLEEAKEATGVAVIVLPIIANEPRKLIATRLDAKSLAFTDPVEALFVSAIRKTT